MRARRAGPSDPGTPWTKTLGGWAFEGDEVPALEVVFSQIPDDVDILVSHSPPPYGFGDRVVGWFGEPGERVGSPALRRAIERARPQLALFGHIHEAHGEFELAESRLANVSLVNERYELTNSPASFLIEPR